MGKNFEIYPVVHELELCKERVDRELSIISKKTLAERELEFNHSFDALEHILKIIGEGLFKAANAALGNDEELTFYFWPGYETLSGKRVLIKGEIENKEKKNYFTGIGFIGNTDKVFYDCPSTLYFDAVLTTHKNYLPPSTHNWKVQQHGDIEIRLKEDQSNLKVLIVEKSGNKKPIISKSKQIMHVTFNGEDVYNAVEKISKVLGSNSKDIYLKSAKADAKKRYIEWPINMLNKKGDIEIINEDSLKEAQRIVYPIWLAATFCDTLHDYDKKYGKDNWLNQAKLELKKLGFKELISRIDTYQKAELIHNKNSNYYKIHFTHWYSLFFNNYDTSNELGSAMFLTNKELPHDFLFYVIPWLKFIYGQIRELDHITEKEVSTKKTAWEENFRLLSHSQNKYLDALKVFANRSNISDEQKNAIIHYKDILEGFLEIAKNFGDLEKYVTEMGNPQPFNLTKEIRDSVSTMELLLEDPEISNSSFKINEQGHHYLSQHQKGKLFNGNFRESEDIIIYTYPDLVKLLIKDLLVNAIENSEKTTPVIDINITKFTSGTILRIENNSIPNDEHYKAMLNPDLFIGRFGMRIIKALNRALRWEMSIPASYTEMVQVNKFFLEFLIPN